MNSFILYIIQMTAASSLFFIFYYVVLKNTTYFRLNRMFLISSLIIPLILPFIKIPGNWLNVSYTMPNLLDEVIIFPDKAQAFQSIAFSEFFRYFYVIVLLILVFRIVYGIILVGILYSSGARSKYNNLKIVVSHRNINPFSIFKLIFVNQSHNDKDSLNQIITHEQVHIKQLHSLDNILSEMVCTLFWINPFFWILRENLKSTHEYLADEEVREQGFDLAGYFMLLFDNVVGIRVGLANNFNQSLTLKRMKMMKRNRSPRYMRWLYLLVVPFMALLIVVISCQNSDGSITLKKISDHSIVNDGRNSALLSDQNDNVYEQVDQMPVFGNGQEDLINYLVKTIEYPEQAKQAGTQGKVYVEFIVSMTGKVKDVKVKRSVDELLDAEAVRVIANMPDWNPGKKDGKPVSVKMTLPINFKLAEKKEK